MTLKSTQIRQAFHPLRGLPLGLIALVTLSALSAYGERTLTSGRDFQFQVRDTLDGSLTGPVGRFDQWPLLCVQPCAGEGCGECLEEQIYSAGLQAPATALSGRTVEFSKFAGKPLLMVNVASC